MPALDTAARVRLMTLIRRLFPSPECVQTVLKWRPELHFVMNNGSLLLKILK